MRHIGYAKDGSKECQETGQDHLPNVNGGAAPKAEAEEERKPPPWDVKPPQVQVQRPDKDTPKGGIKV